MTLTSKGRAMENGAKGQSIRVQNTQSKIVVEGEVVSPGTVRVAGLQPVQY
jgi:flagella basal body P-ring formation protein FlgA